MARALKPDLRPKIVQPLRFSFYKLSYLKNKSTIRKISSPLVVAFNAAFIKNSFLILSFSRFMANSCN